MKGCRHRQVEMYGPPHGPVGSRKIRVWRCVTCGQQISEQQAGKAIRLAARQREKERA